MFRNRKEGPINPVSPSADGCGLTPELGQTRIMGGSEARLGQFPWVAYLSVRGPDIDKMCAGTLIADRSGRALC